MPGPFFTPTLKNNTDPLDFIIYTYEQANPGQAIANAFFGSIAQAFTFGVIVIAISGQTAKYYWRFSAEDNWAKILLVTNLVALTTADFVHHQYISYNVIANTSPITGHGIANVYKTYWKGAFVESFFVAFAQPQIMGYFVWRAFSLWGNNLYILVCGGFLVLLTFALGVTASIWCITQAPLKWNGGGPDLVYAMRNVESMLRYTDKGYKIMSAWLCSSTAADCLIAFTLIVAMLKHSHKAKDMKHMEGVRDTLKRGMLFTIESMALVVANQTAHTVILMTNMGLSQCLRAVMALRMPLSTFAVIWSLNSRAELKAMLDNTSSRGPISFSSSCSFGKSKISSNRSKDYETDQDPNIELGPYNSVHSLVHTPSNDKSISASSGLPGNAA